MSEKDIGTEWNNMREKGYEKKDEERKKDEIDRELPFQFNQAQAKVNNQSW